MSMADALVCRLCHRNLLDEAGCEVCLPVKPHLMPSEAADEDNVPLAKLAAESASLLRQQLKQLAGLQKNSQGYDAVLANESRAHANALAKLLDSARKLQEDGASAVETMSFQEKAALMIEFFQGLPPAYRRQLYSRMGQFIAGPAEEAKLDDKEITTN